MNVVVALGATGALLVAAAIALPSSGLIAFLRPELSGTDTPLLQGARLFRVGLAVLGLALAGGALSARRWAPAAPAPAAARPVGRREAALLALLLLAATALRVPGLGAGLWYDEILTFSKFARMPYGEIVSTYDSQNNHFVYSLAAHASFSLLGESASSVRLPAVLFGVGSIAALWLLARLVTGTRESLLACALLTFSYHHIWFSQNARGYSALLLWTNLSSWLLVRACRERRVGLWLLYGVAVSLGVWTHMTMLFVILGHFVIFAVHALRRRLERPSPWIGMLGFVFAGLLVFQLHALVLPQLFGGTLWQGVQSTVGDWKSPAWTVLEMLRGLAGANLGGIVAFAGLFVLGVGVVSYAREEPVVVQLLFLPAALGGLLTMALGHPLWPRFFFFAAGFAVLVVVRATTVLGRRAASLLRSSPRIGDALGTALVVLGILLTSPSLRHVYGPKQDFDGAFAYVQRHSAPGDVVVTVGIATDAFRKLHGVDWPAVEKPADVDAVRADAPRTWLVYTLPLHVESVYPELMAKVRTEFTVEARFQGTLGGGTIFVCSGERKGS
jgi:4-amino-4-deoxy-L-arabinose transferase-like glycosyltransferase